MVRKAFIVKTEPEEKTSLVSST